MIKIKSLYDPFNFFSNPQSIPVTRPRKRPYTILNCATMDSFDSKESNSKDSKDYKVGLAVFGTFIIIMGCISIFIQTHPGYTMITHQT